MDGDCDDEGGRRNRPAKPEASCAPTKDHESYRRGQHTFIEEEGKGNRHRFDIGGPICNHEAQRIREFAEPRFCTTR